ncbi:uncharacterized protein LOC135489383 [Lineus longissimus]|uniref:uncharacterized protein LOC135489383 n=1 Tax=Lineus longissimus TaxID=88925 RepID=UPI00315D89A6
MMLGHLKKNLLKLSKEKECELAAQWCKAIINHLYYVASNTPEGQADLIIAKWLSLDNHVNNVHRGHGELFPKCGHGRLGRTKQRRNKWLTAGTKVSTQLTKIITAKRFVKDVGKISCGQQTSGLEAFNSVINHFAPKQFHFSHEGMESRLRVAALHYNENGNKDQAVTQDGQERWEVLFPKVKKGGYSVRPVRKPSTCGYTQRLLLEVQCRCVKNLKAAKKGKFAALCDNYEHPEKAEAVDNYKTKFKRFKNTK